MIASLLQQKATHGETSARLYEARTFAYYQYSFAFTVPLKPLKINIFEITNFFHYEI